MLLVAIALVAAPATASAESGEPPGARTVTTTLRPGWTMIAWLGPDATVAELFDDIPALERVSLWDAAGRRYESWPRGRVPRDGERRLTAGAGVWLRLGGDAAVEWTRSAATGGVLLSLSAGRNLVGWLGPDGAAVGAVLARFGETLVRASRWDTQSQRYLHYRPGDPPAQNTLVELERGDGLWVELTDGARWWQGGEADVEFEAPESVPAAELARIRADLAPVLAFFAERYGIEPPDFTVAFVPELLTRLGPSVAAASPGKILIHAPSVDHVGAGALAHEYFHVLQVHLARGGPAVGSSPAWMTEGSATYAADLYLREEVRDTDAEALHRGRWRTSLGLEHMLQGYEAPEPFYAEASPTYTLGALAVEWLSGHAALSGDGGSLLSDTAWTRQLADEGAHVEYYRLLSSATEWGEALEGAFGLAPRDFYERFESYLSAVTQAILPHLGDGVDEPVVTSSPGVPAARASEFREHLRRLGSLLADHLGTRTADYTLHVAADDASASAAVGEVSREICFHRSLHPAVFVVNASCRLAFRFFIDSYHLDHVIDRLAPPSSLPPAGGGDPHGPMWLTHGIRAYVRHASEAASGVRTMNDIRSEKWERVRGLRDALATFGTRDDFQSVGFERAAGLSYLAVEWLAGRAGEPALLDYYRRLPSSSDWRAAFAGAFGLGVDDFQHAFEEYRADAGPPTLHRIRGWIWDRDGNASPGTVVVATRDGLRWEDVAVTGRDGSYELDLRDGRYRVLVDLGTTRCAVPSDDPRYDGRGIAVNGFPQIVWIRLPDGSSCS